MPCKGLEEPLKGRRAEGLRYVQLCTLAQGVAPVLLSGSCNICCAAWLALRQDTYLVLFLGARQRLLASEKILESGSHEK